MYPYAWKHVTQLEDLGGGLTGNNNCGQASVGRYLRETKFPFPGTDHDLIAHLRYAMTGEQENPYEGYTSLDQVLGYLGQAGLPYTESADPKSVLVPWTLCLVRGVRLAPAQYPPSWFNNTDADDHFILRLPDDLVNDPLAPVGTDVTYTHASLVAAAQDGVFLTLPDPARVTWDAQRVAHVNDRPLKPPYATAAAYKVAVPMHLRADPEKDAPLLGLVQKGDPLYTAHNDTTLPSWTTSWRYVKTAKGVAGYAYAPNLDVLS